MLLYITMFTFVNIMHFIYLWIALRKTSSKNAGKQHSHLPWARRKSPPVLSFFKRVASLRKHPETSKQKDACNANRCGYRTLPTPKRRDLNVPGYTCFPFDSGFTSLKRNYCCDGYFGCPPVNKNWHDARERMYTNQWTFPFTVSLLVCHAGKSENSNWYMSTCLYEICIALVT